MTRTTPHILPSLPLSAGSRLLRQRHRTVLPHVLRLLHLPPYRATRRSLASGAHEGTWPN